MGPKCHATAPVMQTPLTGPLCTRQVTDSHDRTLLSTLLGSFYTPSLLAPNAPLCPGGTYEVPRAGEHKVRGGAVGPVCCIVSSHHPHATSHQHCTWAACNHSLLLACFSLVIVLTMPPRAQLNLHPNSHSQSYVDYIQGLPLLSPPEAFGLGPNADISRDLREGGALLESMLATQVCVWGGSG